MLSRVLGFTRDILIARALGAGPVADAFFVAFRFPNVFRNLFAEGAFNASFVPVFSRLLERRGVAEAREFAEFVLSFLLIALVLFFFAVEAAMPFFVTLVAPGFAESPDKFELAVRYTRLTLPFLLFVSLAALLSAILNSLYRFAAAAGAPILLNVALIAVLSAGIGVIERLGTSLSLAVAVGGALQFLILVAACHRAGMSLRLVRPRLSDDVRRMLRLLAPAAAGAGAAQINLVVATALASTLGTGAISYLYYAERLNWLPIGVVGVALGTAVLPRISRLLQAGEDEAAMATQNRAMELLALLGLPAAAALLTIPEALITVLFVRGAFTAEDAAAAAPALQAFSAGLPAYLLVRVLLPAFFARHDTKTPVKIAFAAMAVHVLASAILMGPLAHVGIALGNAMAAWANAVLLWVVLRRRGAIAIDARLWKRLPRIAAATAVLVAVLLLLSPHVEPLLVETLWVKIGGLVALIVVGAVSYAVAALVIGAATLSDIKHALGRGA